MLLQQNTTIRSAHLVITSSFFLLIASVLFLLCASVTVHAASANAKWFRYYENGVPQVTHSLSDKHIKAGYEELDASFRVIKKVPAYSAEAAAAEKAKKEAALDAQQKAQATQKKLRQTYGSSDRVARKRNELLSNIKSKRGFVQQQYDAAKQALDMKLQQAAKLEKQGKPVADALKAEIATKRNAVAAAKRNIDDLMKHKMARVDALTRDMRKLRKLEKRATNQ